MYMRVTTCFQHLLFHFPGWKECWDHSVVLSPFKDFCRLPPLCLCHQSEKKVPICSMQGVCISIVYQTIILYAALHSEQLDKNVLCFIMNSLNLSFGGKKKKCILPKTQIQGSLFLFKKIKKELDGLMPLQKFSITY